MKEAANKTNAPGDRAQSPQERVGRIVTGMDANRPNSFSLIDWQPNATV